MKTVKRKAEVGEQILSMESGKIFDVAEIDEHGVLFVRSIASKEPTYIDHKNYEVIIEDEPKGIAKRLEKFRKEMRRKHGGEVEFSPVEDEPKIEIMDLLAISEKALEELRKLDALINKKVEDELKDEAMKRLLTPDQAREKLKLPHRVHPKASNREHDATDYGGPLGTPIPPHSSHYHQNGLDPLEVMRRTFPPEQYEGFLRGSLLKYTMRYDRKGQEAEDLEKAEFYSEALKRWKEAAE